MFALELPQAKCALQAYTNLAVKLIQSNGYLESGVDTYDNNGTHRTVFVPSVADNDLVYQESQSVLNRTANESEDQTVCLSRLGEVNKLEPCGCENLISRKDLKTCETLLFSFRKLKIRKNTGTGTIMYSIRL